MSSFWVAVLEGVAGGEREMSSAVVVRVDAKVMVDGG